MLGILSTLAGLILPRLVPSLSSIAESFAKKEISQAEMHARIAEAVQSSLAETETAHSDSLAKTFAAFMGAAHGSRLMQAVWGVVTLSQLGVLLWHQVGIPAYVHLTGWSYPSSGTTTEWAYLLVAFCLGGGPILLRSGPGRA